jgi:hypothetical protein
MAAICFDALAAWEHVPKATKRYTDYRSTSMTTSTDITAIALTS